MLFARKAQSSHLGQKPKRREPSRDGSGKTYEPHRRRRDRSHLDTARSTTTAKATATTARKGIDRAQIARVYASRSET
jgi:hypothetical protein